MVDGSQPPPDGGGTAHLGIREIGGVRFFYRAGSVDEEVLQEEYTSRRFFASGYEFGENDTVLDVGAHIGSFALTVAPLVRRGAVHAIEPGSESFAILQANIDANGFAQAQAHRLALSAERGTVRLYHAPASWGHTIVGPHPMAPPTYEEVPTDTLEGFLESNGIRSVDYLKMNIEGAEYAVLLGAPTNVLRSIRCMLVELHPAEDVLSDELLHRLDACGFTTEMVWSNNPAVKGWLTARQ